MTEAIEQLIRARFDRIANPIDDADWTDVLSRAGRRRRRRSTRPALAAAAAVALAATAVGFGWPRTMIDYFEAAPAPQSVQDFFDTYGAAVPQGMSHATLGQAREVMTASFDANDIPPTNHPAEHTLYAAPRTGGGFCWLWTDYGGGCADPEDAAAAVTNPGARPFGVEWLQGDYATFADGYVRGDAQTVEARFADGTSVTLPVTWVSAPIDAGFFAYNVPASHWTTSDALTSVVALDANGNVVGEDDIGVTKPLDQDVMQTLPDGKKYSLPRRAEAARARELTLRTASGAHAYLWAMPRRGGGSCFLYGTGRGGGFGCTSPAELAQMPAVFGIESDRGLYVAEVKPSIASVELRYANGARDRLTPTAGFVLGDAFAGGSRLVSAVGLAASGSTVYSERLPQRYHATFGG